MEQPSDKIIVQDWVKAHVEEINRAIDLEREDIGIDNFSALCAGLFKYFNRDILPSDGSIRVVNTNNTLHVIIKIGDYIVDPTYQQFEVPVSPEDLVEGVLVGTKEYLQEKYDLEYRISS